MDSADCRLAYRRERSTIQLFERSKRAVMLKYLINNPPTKTTAVCFNETRPYRRDGRNPRAGKRLSWGTL